MPSKTALKKPLHNIIIKINWLIDNNVSRSKHLLFK